MKKTFLAVVFSMLVMSASSQAKVVSEVFLNIPWHHSASFEMTVSKLLKVYAASVSDMSSAYHLEKQNIESLDYLSAKQKRRLVKILGEVILKRERTQAFDASLFCAIDQQRKVHMDIFPLRWVITEEKY